ncbi:MAG: hypothetical protein LBE38_01250 [Deltaproteobacteria bacterium]|jgi:hypothetical protein|nr:hypothetical protein [Deltaproteobacteria bacterium]
MTEDINLEEMAALEEISKDPQELKRFMDLDSQFPDFQRLKVMEFDSLVLRPGLQLRLEGLNKEKGYSFVLKPASKPDSLFLKWDGIFIESGSWPEGMYINFGGDRDGANILYLQICAEEKYPKAYERILQFKEDQAFMEKLQKAADPYKVRYLEGGFLYFRFSDKFKSLVKTSEVFSELILDIARKKENPSSKGTLASFFIEKIVTIAVLLDDRLKAK